MHYVIYEGKKLPFEVITNKKLKHLYITIHPKKGVIVKNPSYSQEKILRIVQQKAKWIFEKSQSVQLKNDIFTLFKNEHSVLLFGEKKPLHVEVNLASFYKKKSQEYVPNVVKKYVNIMDLEPISIKFRKSKRRWGSCSYKNELTFNSSLIQLPQECIDYVVIHELSHIVHKHHQKSFWLHVEKYMPNYKECEKIIKNYSPYIGT